MPQSLNPELTPPGLNVRQSGYWKLAGNPVLRKSGASSEVTESFALTFVLVPLPVLELPYLVNSLITPCN
jgi:hypothetical protein